MAIDQNDLRERIDRLEAALGALTVENLGLINVLTDIVHSGNLDRPPNWDKSDTKPSSKLDHIFDAIFKLGEDLAHDGR